MISRSVSFPAPLSDPRFRSVPAVGSNPLQSLVTVTAGRRAVGGNPSRQLTVHWEPMQPRPVPPCTESASFTSVSPAGDSRMHRMCREHKSLSTKVSAAAAAIRGSNKYRSQRDSRANTKLQRAARGMSTPDDRSHLYIQGWIDSARRVAPALPSATTSSRFSIGPQPAGAVGGPGGPHGTRRTAAPAPGAGAGAGAADTRVGRSCSGHVIALRWLPAAFLPEHCDWRELGQM